MRFGSMRIADPRNSRLAMKADKIALAAEWHTLAEKVQAAFNARFWNESLNCCFDVVGENGNDATIRPNQIFAVSLPDQVLLPERQKAVIQKVVRRVADTEGCGAWPARSGVSGTLPEGT